MSEQRSGKLVVVRYAGVEAINGIPYHSWLCRCDCGNTKTVKTRELRAKIPTSSCGCLPRSVPKDITGNRYGRLLAKEIQGKSGNGDYNWLCLCDCGKLTTTTIGRLNSGHTKSCGCLLIDMASEISSTHKKSRSTEYKSWLKMRERCHNIKCKDFKDYGALGIFVQDSWRKSFEDFYLYVGDKPTKYHTIDRIDPLSGYEEGNVRWSTPSQQSRNSRGCRGCSSKYKGVCYEKSSGLWSVSIAVNNVKRKVGRYLSEDVAGHIYNKAFILIFGEDYEYRQLNDVLVEDCTKYYKGSFWRVGYQELQRQVKIVDGKYI